MSKRHFTEKEVARILRRASEMQARSGTAPEGVSADELRRVAAEVGIEEHLLNTAIAEVDSVAQDDGQTRWLGAPPSYELERFVQGDLSEDAWHLIVGELNSAFHQGMPGVTAGPVRTWHYKHDMGSVTFTATQGPNSVRLKTVIFLDDGLAVGMVFAIMAMIVSLLPSFAMDDAAIWLRILIPMVLVPTVWLGFTRYVRSWYAKDRRKIGHLMDKLEAFCTESSPVTSSLSQAITPELHESA